MLVDLNVIADTSCMPLIDVDDEICLLPVVGVVLGVRVFEDGDLFKVF